MKNILVSVCCGKGFITHQDQEVDGLSFQIHSLDDGRAVVVVFGTNVRITAWANRVGGSFITEKGKVDLLEASEKRGLEIEISNQEAELSVKKVRLEVLNSKVKKNE